MNNVLLINESLFQVDNKMKPYEKLLTKSVLEFCKEQFGFDASVTVRKKNNDFFIGDVVLNDNSVNQNKFTVHYNPNYSISEIIRSLFHELTHVKQISNKELRPAPDWKSLQWKDDFEISLRKYKSIMKKNPKAYLDLPWEKEAKANQNDDVLFDKFIESKYFKDLKGKDDTMDFVINDILSQW